MWPDASACGTCQVSNRVHVALALTRLALLCCAVPAMLLLLRLQQSPCREPWPLAWSV